MAVAASTHAPNGFFNTSGGYELPATFGLVGVVLALGGPGRISLDHALRHKLNRKWMAFAALASTAASAAHVHDQRSSAAPRRPRRGRRRRVDHRRLRGRSLRRPRSSLTSWAAARRGRLKAHGRHPPQLTAGSHCGDTGDVDPAPTNHRQSTHVAD